MCRAIDDKSVSEVPFKLISELTYSCNLKCIYCHNPVNKSYFAKELDTVTWKSIIVKAKEAGVLVNSFTGGEPLLRPDLMELVKFSKDLGLITRINTNASLVNEETASQLSKLELDYAQVGLPSLNKKTDERITEVRGILQKRIDGIKNLTRYNIQTSLNVVLTRWNLTTIEEMVMFAEKYGISDLTFQSTFLFGRAAANIKNDILPTTVEMRQVSERIQELRDRVSLEIHPPHMIYYDGDPMPCSWNREGIIVVTPNGLVTPCEPASNLFPEVKFDSVSDSSLFDIWNDSEAFKKFENTAYLPNFCQTCRVIETCRGGCRVVSYLLTGNLMSEDPSCILSEKRKAIELYISPQEGSRHEV